MSFAVIHLLISIFILHLKEILPVIWCSLGSISIDLFDYFPNAHPHIQNREDFHNASAICEWCFLQNGEVFHHSIVNNVLYDLIDEINLTAVKIDVIQYDQYYENDHIKKLMIILYSYYQHYIKYACFSSFIPTKDLHPLASLPESVTFSVIPSVTLHKIRIGHF